MTEAQLLTTNTQHQKQKQRVHVPYEIRAEIGMQYA